MVNAQSSLELASEILKNYTLCHRCILRQSTLAGSDLKKQFGLKNEPCYICNDLMIYIDNLLTHIVEELKEHQFNTFLIGAILPQQMLEHEDEIRSRFKIKGTESIKSDLTRALGKLLGSATGKSVDYHRPDVTINVDMVKNQVAVRARAIYLYGRYVKNIRGLNQKQERCGACGGKGCSQCNMTGLSGFDSVEGIITRKLIDSFKCDSAKFAWVGGEDKDSLVLNEGRPFFVKVINPRSRFAELGLNSHDNVQVRFINEVDRLPDKPLRFRVKVKLTIECERSIDDSTMQKLKQLNNATVRFADKKSKEVNKNIYEFDAKASNNTLEVLMLVDGGLTIKHFVGGDGMEPSISQLIGCKASCKSFDILRVQFVD